jgi:putative inorganic carbon (hco3(-)) transporter
VVAPLRPGHPAPDTLARLPQPQRLLSARALAAVRAPLLVALVVGLAVSISLSQIMLGVLVAWVLLARQAGVVDRLRWPLLTPILVFAAWSVVAALASGHAAASVHGLKGLLSLGALFVILNALPEPADARRFAVWLLLALTGAAVLGLVQVAACPGLDTVGTGTPILGKFLRKCTRARGFYSIYMTLAGVLAMMLTSALPRLARLGGEARWLGPAWLVGGAALGLTYVHDAWLGFAASALTAAAGLGRRGLIAAAAVVVLAGGLVLGLPTVRARMETIGDPNNDTTRDRMAMMQVGFELVAAHPLTGIGPDGVKRVYPQLVPAEGMRRSTSHLHNTPLQIAAERGVVGFAAWLWIFVAFFRRAFTVWRRLPPEPPGDRALVLGSLAALVTFLVAGLFEYNFGDTEVLLVATALMALPFAVAGDRVSADPCRPA